jgi:hypothetical protein
MKKIILLILFGLISQFTVAQNPYKNLITIRFVEDYESHYTGDIRTEIDTTSIDRYTHKPVFDPMMENYNQDSLVQIINQELNKYPIEVLKLSRLVEVVICDGAYFNDENNEPTSRAAGTYIYGATIGNIIFLDGYDHSLPATLHHEFSSVLFKQMIESDSIFYKKYLELELYFKQTTKYIEDSQEFQNGDFKRNGYKIQKNIDNKLVLRGDGYALTAFENDYNSIAAALFNSENAKMANKLLVDKDKDLWDFIPHAKTEQYPIYKKVIMVIDLYNYINPTFTISYFKNL